MKKKIIVIFGIILIVAGGIWGYFGLFHYLAEKNAGNIYEDMKDKFGVKPLLQIPTMGEGEPEVPIDFASLTAQYPDIYAWIRVPGTRIDYPIVRREGDNDYYVTHTVDGRKRIEGAIFTDDYNSKDFGDPNTVIYGHNMKNGSMFKALHKYKDRQFFDEHPEVFIYQEGRVLRYKVFAAYTYDDRHIMMSFDFENEIIFQSYLNSVLTNKDMRSNIDTTTSVTTEDKIITLCTCSNTNEKERYLVQAVLLSIQE